MLKLIRPLALFIMIAAMASSYHTQLVLFRPWEVDLFTAVIAPFAVDALAVICSIAIGAKGASGKTLAAVVLVLTLGASMAANFIAGATLGSRIVHAGMVLIYLMAELVASKVKAGEEKAEETTPAKTSVEVPDTLAELESPSLREKPIPVSPAPAGGRRPIPAAMGPKGRMVHAETGEPLATRTERRKRNGN